MKGKTKILLIALIAIMASIILGISGNVNAAEGDAVQIISVGDTKYNDLKDKTYVDLAAAVAAIQAKSGDYPDPNDNTKTIAVTDNGTTTIKLLKDIPQGGGVVVNTGRKIVFDLGGNANFEGYTYNVFGPTVGSSGTETNGFQLLRDSNVTIKNGKITSSVARVLIQNYSNLTLRDVTLELSSEYNSDQGSVYCVSCNNGVSSIEGNTTLKVKTRRICTRRL